MHPARLLASVIVSSALIAVPSIARAQTVYGGAQTLNGLQNQANTRGNFQLQERRNAELRRSFRAQDIIEDERRKLHPLKPPIVDVTPDASADAIPSLAKFYQGEFLKTESVPQVAQYLHGRYDAYGSSVSGSGLRVSSLASACDYAAENLYAVGAHVDATAQRQNIRGTCTMYMQYNENNGHLTTNAQRYAFFQQMALAGSVYRDLDKNTAGSERNALVRSEAQVAFKQLFHMDITNTPPSKFVCIFATPTTSCDLVQRIYPKYFPKLIAQYP